METETNFGLDDLVEIKEEFEDSLFYENELYSMNNVSDKKNLGSDLGSLTADNSTSLTASINSLIDHDFDSDSKSLLNHSNSLYPFSTHSEDSFQKTSKNSIMKGLPMQMQPPLTDIQNSPFFSSHHAETNLFEKASKFFSSKSASSHDSSENLFMRSINENFATPQKCFSQDSHISSQSQASEISQGIPLQMNPHMFSSCVNNFKSHFHDARSVNSGNSQNVTVASSFGQNLANVFESTAKPTYNRSNDNLLKTSSLFQIASNYKDEILPSDSPAESCNDGCENGLKPPSLINIKNNSMLEEANNKEVKMGYEKSDCPVYTKQPIKPTFKPVFKKPRKMLEKELDKSLGSKASKNKNDIFDISSSQNETHLSTDVYSFEPSHNSSITTTIPNSITMKPSVENIISSGIKENNLALKVNEVADKILTSPTSIIETPAILTEKNHNLPIHTKLKSKLNVRSKSTKYQSDVKNITKHSASPNADKTLSLEADENFKDKCSAFNTKEKAKISSSSLLSDSDSNSGQIMKKVLNKHLKNSSEKIKRKIPKSKAGKQSKIKLNESKTVVLSHSPSKNSDAFYNKKGSPLQETVVSSEIECISDVEENSVSSLSHQLSTNAEKVNNTCNKSADAAKFTSNGTNSLATVASDFHDKTVAINSAEKETSSETNSCTSQTQNEKNDELSPENESIKLKKIKTKKSLVSKYPFIASRKARLLNRQSSFKKLKKNDPKLEKIKERLYELQDQTKFPVWVQCDDCKKWRCLEDIEDPATLPKEWICSLHSDETLASCDAPGETSAEDDCDEKFVFNKYTLGSVVWVTSFGPDWWPAMVDDDPDTETFFWLPDSSNVPNYYHVTFFGHEVSRAWIRSNCILQFKACGLQNRKATTKRAAELFKEAVAEAKLALTLPLKDRRRIYCFATRFKGNWFADSRSQDDMEDV